MAGAYSSDTNQFHALSSFLEEHQGLWKERPFVHEHLSWESDYPEVSAWLRALPESSLDAIESDPFQLRGGPLAFQKWAQTSVELTQLPSLHAEETDSLSTSWRKGVPGRKTAQIDAFIGSLRASDAPFHGEWVEWCSGKGHLGRAMLAAGVENMHSLERNPKLTEMGEKGSVPEHQTHTFHTLDVFSPETLPLLMNKDGALALHACGSLTDRLFEVGTSANTRFIAASPCCYHAMETGKYTPKSRPGKETRDFDLTSARLRLLTAEVVVARPSSRKHRIQEMAWRLSLDKRIREEMGVKEYIPQGRFPSSIFQTTLGDFMTHASRAMDIPLSPISSSSLQTLEEWGYSRAKYVRGLATVRALFRRPLETWLNLDRTLYLQEQGRASRLTLFCSRELTPRNQIIISEIS